MTVCIACRKEKIDWRGRCLASVQSKEDRLTALETCFVDDRQFRAAACWAEHQVGFLFHLPCFRTVFRKFVYASLVNRFRTYPILLNFLFSTSKFQLSTYLSAYGSLVPLWFWFSSEKNDTSQSSDSYFCRALC